MKSLTLLFLLFLIIYSPIRASIHSAQNGDWEASSTWSGGVIPDAAVDVVIDHDVALASFVHVQHLTVSPGASVTFNAGAYLRIFSAGSLTNNGSMSFDPSTSVDLNGDALLAGTTTFAYLILSGPGSIDVGAGTTVGTSLIIAHPGAILTGHSPVYGFNSILDYRIGGAYTPGLEWVPGPNGAGVPCIVYVGFSTTLSFIGSAARTVRNYISIDNMDGASELKLSAESGGDLRIVSGFYNNGSFTPNGRKVIMAGADGGTIAGSSETVFDELVIDSPAGVNIENNITVDGALTFITGVLHTGAWMATLGTAGSLVNEQSGSNVDGQVKIIRPVGTAGNSMGNIGVTISAGADDAGDVQVLRTSGPDGIITRNGKSGIACCWKITLSNAVPAGRDVTLQWNADVDNSKTLSIMRMWISNNLTTWGTLSPADEDASGRSIIARYVSGTPGYAYFTASDNVSALPVELVSLTAFARGQTVRLAWKTASEVQNYGFEVERSKNGSGTHAAACDTSGAHWEMVGFVKGAGTSNAQRDYSYADEVRSHGNYAYRLKQIDRDGSYAYSRAIGAEVTAAPGVFELCQNYPNPFNPSTTIAFTVPDEGYASLKIYSLLGQHAATLFEGHLQAGETHSVSFDGSRLSSGVYLSVLECNGNRLVKKITLTK